MEKANLPAIRTYAVAPHHRLVMKSENGEAWNVTFSPGIETFIGIYPRLPDMAVAGGLLKYDVVF